MGAQKPHHLKKLAVPLYFGTLHGINDAVAGFLLAAYSLSASSAENTVFAFLGYSVIAFGGQLPAGWLLDTIKKPVVFVYSCLLLLMAACIMAPFHLPLAILLSGLASALVHVSGGTICYLHNTKSTAASGIFTAPGVLGLIIGGLAGHEAHSLHILYVLPVIVLFLFLLGKMTLPQYAVLDKKDQQPILETHDYVMLVLLLAIAMRSMIWNVLYLLAEQQQVSWLLGIGISAFAGKLFGGLITEKMDWKKYVFVSVGSAAVLLAMGKEILPVFCAGIFLLQSAVPVTLWMMQQYLHRQPAAAAALSLGIAIILAGLPSYLKHFREIREGKTFLLATFVLLFLLNGFWVLKTKRREPKPS